MYYLLITVILYQFVWTPYWPLSTMRTFFHWVLPTLGVWQNKILCLSQTKMRSRTNLLMETWVKFVRLLFLHTAESRWILLSTTDCQAASVGTAVGWDRNIMVWMVCPRVKRDWLYFQWGQRAMRCISHQIRRLRSRFVWTRTKDGFNHLGARHGPTVATNPPSIVWKVHFEARVISFTPPATFCSCQ